MSYSVLLFLQVQALSHLKYSYGYQHLWYAWEENAMYLSKDLVLSLWKKVQWTFRNYKIKWQ